MTGNADVVVFGGTGFIGRPLVRRLAEAGHRVRVVSRRAAPLFADCPGVSCERGDVAEPEAVAAAIRGAATVYLLTTGGGDSWADFERDVVRGTAHVAEACVAAGVQRLIYTSSIAALYLGDRGVVDESYGVDARPYDRCLYARAKIAAEAILRQAHAERGLPVVIVRPGLVVGEGGSVQHAGVGYWSSDTCCIGWGTGDTPLPFVLVNDVADALSRAMSAVNVAGQTMNLVAAPPITASEYVHLIASHSLRPFRFYPRPLAWLQGVDVAKWAVKAAARKPDNAFPSMRELRSRTARTRIDCSRARALLGWQPNGTRDAFIRGAILPHVDPVLPGDLRLTGGAA
jgi:nucleoside-diphosphate-sugar epimerase